MSPTSCARRSPTSSASRSCSPTAAPARSIQAARIRRLHPRFVARRCSPSSTTFSISPRSTPAPWSCELDDVDVADAMKAAAEGVQDRLREASIELRIVATDGVGRLRADGRRVRQVLFNLSLQRHRLLGGRADGDAGGDAAAEPRSCSRSATAAAAFPPRCWSECSTGSKPSTPAPAIAAPASACRSCGRWSNCTAAASLSIPRQGRARRSPAFSRPKPQKRRPLAAQLRRIGRTYADLPHQR